MSFTHLHLLLNHLPVIGSVFAILLLGAAWLRRSTELAKAGLSFFALLGAVSIVVYLTGEPAEQLVEDLPGFSEAITERHEEMALVATIVSGAFGAAAIVALWFNRGRFLSRRLMTTALGLSLGVGGILGWTAFLGGQIRHTEIRSGAVRAAGESGEESEH